MTTPEEKARERIDYQLNEAGWIVQNRDEINLSASPGVIIREFPLLHGAGYADYMIFVNAKPVGVLEAKPEGYPVRSVEVQTDKYTAGLAYDLKPPVTPLPFCYVSTGTETIFWNHLDPQPRSRRVFQFHRPETLAEGAQYAESEHQGSLAILVSRHLCGLSECNERARENAYDSRKDAESARKALKCGKE